MLHYAELNKPQFIKLLHVGRLEDFVEGQPEKIDHTVEDFLSDASEANVLLIRSDIGNGGTHLLSGAANHLLDKGEVIMCMTSEILRRDLLAIKDELRQYLLDCSFACIDYVDYLMKCPDTFREVCSMLNSFLSKGGKIIVQSSKNLNDTDISEFLNARKIIQVTCEFPSLDTLKIIALQHVTPEVVQDFAEEALAKSENSVRVFLGFL
ncbi:MAG: Bacterial dnaA protein, partial [Bacteroidota bacterium]